MKPANFNGLGLGNRFWSKVDFNGPVRVPLTPCWVWTGYKNAPDGYGRIMVMGKLQLAHRLVLAAKLGRPIGEDLQACHRCDVRTCVNPGHLFEDDNAGNIADCVSKGRRANLKGEAHGMHKLTEDDVRAIRVAPGTLEEIGARFGIHFATVSKIRLRKIWRCVA